MKVFENFFLSDDVSGADIILDELLPFVHTTPLRNANKIIESLELEKKRCAVFREDLLYFYYARPAYRKVETEASTDKSLLPVVFVVRPALINIKSVYPFDTGAYTRYYVPAHLSEDCEIYDYEMPNTTTAIQQYLMAVCGNNRSYFSGEFKSGNELPDSIKVLRKSNYDLDNLLNLISYTGRSNVDDRSYTVEVQTAENVGILDKLLAIIAPIYCTEDPKFIRMVQITSAEPYYYSFQPRHRVVEYVDVVYELVKKYYIDSHYMEEES